MSEVKKPITPSDLNFCAALGIKREGLVLATEVIKIVTGKDDIHPSDFIPSHIDLITLPPTAAEVAKTRSISFPSLPLNAKQIERGSRRIQATRLAARVIGLGRRFDRNLEREAQDKAQTMASKIAGAADRIGRVGNLKKGFIWEIAEIYDSVVNPRDERGVRGPYSSMDLFEDLLDQFEGYRRNPGFDFGEFGRLAKYPLLSSLVKFLPDSIKPLNRREIITATPEIMRGIHSFLQDKGGRNLAEAPKNDFSLSRVVIRISHPKFLERTEELTSSLLNYCYNLLPEDSLRLSRGVFALARNTTLAILAGRRVDDLASQVFAPFTVNGVRNIKGREYLLNGLFRITLGRNIDAEGFRHYRARLGEGASILDIRREVLSSDEFRDCILRLGEERGNQVAVQFLYKTVLERVIDPEGLETYITSDRPLEQVLVELLSSEEYQSIKR